MPCLAQTFPFWTILNLILAWLGWSPSNLRFMTLSKLRNLKKSPCFSATLLDSPSWPLAANLLRYVSWWLPHPELLGSYLCFLPLYQPWPLAFFPWQIVDFLNDLNVAFDEIITRFDVYKVGVRHFRAFILSRFHPESWFRKIMMAHLSFSLVLDHLLTFFSFFNALIYKQTHAKTTLVFYTKKQWKH